LVVLRKCRQRGRDFHKKREKKKEEEENKRRKINSCFKI